METETQIAIADRLAGHLTGRLVLRDAQLAERVAAVDEEPSVRGRRARDPLERPLAGVRVATVEGADADGEDEVVGASSGWRTKSSAATWRTSMWPEAISSWAAALAWAMAADERSMARMCPVVSRAAMARAAAPGPQPISSTRESGRRGSASMTACRRGEDFGDAVIASSSARRVPVSTL